MWACLFVFQLYCSFLLLDLYILELFQQSRPGTEPSNMFLEEDDFDEPRGFQPKQSKSLSVCHLRFADCRSEFGCGAFS